MVDRLPFSLKILLENLLRNEDGLSVSKSDIETLAAWDVSKPPEREIAFRTSRVLLQDFTGVPAIVDLAAMRDAIAALGGDPKRINPLQPVDLVIDHSVQVDEYGSDAALLSMRGSSSSGTRSATDSCGGGRRRSRISASSRRTPGSSIRSTSSISDRSSSPRAKMGARGLSRLAGRHRFTYDDDQRTRRLRLGRRRDRSRSSHAGTAAVDAGPGGRGFPSPWPAAARCDRHRSGPHGHPAAAQKKVVGKFVEFYGPGLSSLSLADRATIANMAPEYGATMGFFPVDAETLSYLRLTGRAEKQVRLVELYTKAQGLFRTDATPDPVFADTLALDLGTVVPSLAGPNVPRTAYRSRKPRRCTRSRSRPSSRP